MKKIIFLFLIVLCSPVLANDDALVVDRMSCADIQSRISELSEIDDADEDVLDEISQLKNDYRRHCTKTASKRRASAKRGIVDAPVAEETEYEEYVEEYLVEETPSEEDIVEEVPAKEDVIEEKNKTDVAEQKTELSEQEILEQELANLDAGLCIDGSKPNKFGCCSGEVFKDLGNAVFACCPKDGGNNAECYPPMVQF